MVRVSVSETYDLSTQTNKMSLIGVHTPKTELIRKTYPGLCMNSKFCKILSQDVVVACASVQPADPLQVGVEAGDIAPEDLFNPILYKAVSNDAMSNIEARIHGLKWGEDAVIDGNSAIVDNDEVTMMADEFPVYYSLLSNRDGFRTANPQKGLEMRGLVPLVFERLDTVGAWASGDNLFHAVEKDDTNAGYLELLQKSIKSVRGNAKPMPRFPTTYITNCSPAYTGTQGDAFQLNGMGDGTPVNEQVKMPFLDPVFTACIIIPPSRLHKLYYRLVIRTWLEFSEVRPIQEVAGYYGLAVDYAKEVYYSDYADVSKMIMDATDTQVDVKSADIKKVMEGR